MSWWVSIHDPEMTCDEYGCGGCDGTLHYLRVEPFSEGGTRVMGGSSEADLNVTYNYSPHYYRVLGIEGGLRGLNDKTAEFALPVLRKGVEALKTDESDDYWESTEGNARRALVLLADWCQQAVDQGKGEALLRVD